MRTKIIAIGIIVMIALCTTLAMADSNKQVNSQNDEVTAASVVEADVEIKLLKEQLNLQSNGRYVTVLIHEVEGYDLEEVIVDTVNISYDGVELAIVDSDAPTYIRDCDEDGNVELMVKFLRADVIAALGVNDFEDDDPSTANCVETTITLAVSGGLTDGEVFEGTDNILLVIPHNWEPEL